MHLVEDSTLSYPSSQGIVNWLRASHALRSCVALAPTLKTPLNLFHSSFLSVNASGLSVSWECKAHSVSPHKQLEACARLSHSLMPLV